MSIIDRSHQLETADVNTAAPRPSLRLTDAIALIVGLVIGAGIFETPAIVAANTNSQSAVLQAWILGGVISIIGALCYAELATTYPYVGGSYDYLKRAFGQSIAILFAWARMSVIQTGSIALLAFVCGDYASQLWRLGSFSSSIYAALAIALLTALNLLGIKHSKRLQNWLTITTILGLLAVIIIGLTVAPAPALMTTAPASSEPTKSWGSAMVFVLLSYGGWNEAAYIAAEIKNYQRNIVRSLLWGIGIITALYVLINLAYLNGLGLAGMAQSQAVAADLLRRALGEPGAVLISLLVVVCTLDSINATIFTGARTTFALGQDVAVFRFLGVWQDRPNTPATAYLLQGAISLALVGLGTITRDGFKTMVDYTAPIFWFFFLLSSLSLLVLRVRDPDRIRPFRVPLYPILPLLFCAACGYLLYSSLVFTGTGAIVGVIVVALGIPFVYWHRQQQIQ
ncbi:APC family permease [Chamaesiphon minutus]|uniref:Amino acid transporter n=1 Tax=Chamaesiphon minutus (strain ATCC 27169 / PCC 6605) TaxID=1173020 RepID=K9UF95_CHAP6|nr:amino acid permease [Chamaesiphon minutus]AFY93505.1 amino acid transporter [Chamaesiphon minutus PCC 6605]